jgi:CheY-like chemotaxis protein
VLRVVLPLGDDLLPFLTQRVAPIPGIKATQTSYVLQVEKRLNDWQIAELPEEGRPAGPGRTVLLVDDDADFVAAAQMVLEAAGCHVITAGSGREALERLREERPALVLLDLIMETPLAGLVVARAIRAERRLQGLPILAISAIYSTEWAGKLPPAEELPFDDFVHKPIEPGQLLEKVRRFIG